ncbi:O-antigen ligase [Paenisporosarcina sp. OV554]|uniref:O-antigen ligase family protein n=1 Tax=Paenisporosarcina sp. OV554 TaxID=2135694 RepID=UPI000D351F9A|nr:O-antigen ligase family protein [Paenisporosarcina sp. OV554]PUB17845.1 O-antigen ligase-like membrane protein [Paenisporosarcina sp. OV554]
MRQIYNKYLPFIWPVVLIVFLLAAYSTNSLLGYFISVVLFIVALVSPKKAILLLFMYVPIRPFLIELNPSLRLAGDLMIAGAFLHVVWKSRHDLRALVTFHVFEYGYFAFLIIGSFSAIVDRIEIGPIILQLRAFIIFYLIYYIVKRLDIKKEDIIQVLHVFIWTTLLIIIQALIEKLSIRGLFMPEEWKQLPLSSKNRVRIYGMVGNPNVLGIYLGFAYFLFYYAKKYISQYNTVWMQILQYLTIGIFVLTYSRGTWIGFFIIAMVYVFASHNFALLKKIVIQIAIALVVVVLPINVLTNWIEDTSIGQEKVQNIQKFDVGGSSGFVDRVGGTFSDETITGSQSSGRLFIVKKGFEVFKDYPIMGTGFSTFGDSASLSRISHISAEYEINRQFYSDNQYIQIIVQTGVLGVLSFAVFLLGMLYALLKTTRTKLTKLMIGVVLGAFFMGLVYNLWEADVFTLLFFAFLAVTLNSQSQFQSIHEDLTRS